MRAASPVGNERPETRGRSSTSERPPRTARGGQRPEPHPVEHRDIHAVRLALLRLLPIFRTSHPRTVIKKTLYPRSKCNQGGSAALAPTGDDVLAEAPRRALGVFKQTQKHTRLYPLQCRRSFLEPCRQARRPLLSVACSSLSLSYRPGLQEGAWRPRTRAVGLFPPRVCPFLPGRLF